jgi:hypothetical protein
MKFSGLVQLVSPTNDASSLNFEISRIELSQN